MGMRFQFFGATQAEWVDNNPVLLQFEMGIESDTNRFKIGDGETAWLDLDYGGITGNVGPVGPQGPVGNAGPDGEPANFSTLLCLAIALG